MITYYRFRQNNKLTHSKDYFTHSLFYNLLYDATFVVNMTIMKKQTFTLLCCLLLSFYSFAQQHKYQTLEEKAFEKALYFTFEGNTHIALHHFKQFAIDYPNSELMPKVTFNTAVILHDLNHIEEAIPLFRKVLYTEYDYEAINEAENEELQKEYIVCKNKSAMHLAEIYLDKRDFDKAATYIYLFDQKHKFQHFCGDGHVSHDMYTAKMYARLYAGQQKHDKAIAELIPFLFEDSSENQNDVLKLLDQLLTTNYTMVELHAFAESTLNSIKIKKEEIILYFLNKRIKLNKKDIGTENYIEFLGKNPLLKKYLSQNATQV